MQADKDRDGFLDRTELVAYFLANDPVVATLKTNGASEARLRSEAETRARDAMTFESDLAAPVKIDVAAAYVNRFATTLPPQKFRIGWPGFGIRRFVTDTVDPRSPKRDSKAAIFSYRRDNEATDKNQPNFLGGIQLGSWTSQLDSGQVPTHYLTVAPGVEADIDGGKKRTDSSVDIGIPISYQHTTTRRLALITGTTLTVTPKWNTDRAFERDVREVSISFAATSGRLARAGYVTGFGDDVSPALTISWQPSVLLESGKVVDPAGNTKLEAIQQEGAYVRAGPRISATLRPAVLSTRLVLNFDYFHRFGVAGKSVRAAYTESRAMVDVTPDGSVGVGVIYRRGHRPPDFGEINSVLVGIGILQ
jgi:hypothetical protein